ncbi:uncharacterized protein LOC134813781 [Bolinopsis microptera]|uniref:uncharacterized protein LOC134813781 n=1 Tax=Bolinopsis microptera TaxID=2820187 RepID=UPI00307948CF
MVVQQFLFKVLLLYFISGNMGVDPQDSNRGCYTSYEQNVGMFPDSHKLAQRQFRSFESCQEWCDANPRCEGVAVSPAYWAYRECFLVGTTHITARSRWTASSLTDCEEVESVNKQVKKGSYTTISCVITGITERATVTWRTSTGPVPNEKFTPVQGIHSGGTQTSTLAVDGTLVNENTAYTCRVTSGSLPDSSHSDTTVNLNVYDVESVNKEAKKGSDTTISCVITGLTETATVTWRTSTGPVPDEKFTPVQGSHSGGTQTSTLAVDGTLVNEDTAYNCRVTSGSLPDSSHSDTTVNLNVYEVESVNKQVKKGSYTTISCVITGLTETATVTWRTSTGPVPDEKFTPVQGIHSGGTQTSTLAVDGTLVNEDTAYTCRVTSGSLPDSSHSDTTVNLNVYDQCTAASKGIFLSEGKGLNITFTLPDSNLVNITKDGVLVEGDLFTGVNNVYSFIKTSVEAGDAGVYKMNHETIKEPASCFSVLIVAVPTKVEKIRLTDNIEGSLKFGSNEFSKIVELLPDLEKMMEYLRYSISQGTTDYGEQDPTVTNFTENDGFEIRGKSYTLNPDKVDLIYDSSGSEIKEFDVSFKITVSTECSPQKTRCNGEPECDDFSDEKGCSTRGAYSKMALRPEIQAIKFPSPLEDHTVCFFTFGQIGMSASMKNDVSQGLEINKKGHYCVVVQNLKVTTYIYGSTFVKDGSDVDVDTSVQEWIMNEGNNIKNIIVYNKVLTATEMVQYITMCGQEGYPAAADLFMDHHFLVTFLKAMSSGEQMSYVVLSSMCAETATPTGKVDLVTTYLCDSGKTITNHCESESDSYCDDSNQEEECQYFKSETVALARNTNGDTQCTRSTIVNEYNNRLGVQAISSANAFIQDCTTSTCTTKAYLEDLMAETDNVWANEDKMTYTNWTAAINTAEGNRPVHLNRDGSWEVEEDTLSDKGTLLCDVGESNSGRAQKALKLGLDSGYSQLKIEKTSVLNKLTMCWAASGSGVLLQYSGLSSISGQDIYIATETINLRIYLTVYIAGFPEYFDLDATKIGTYFCLRWEKITGRIDLAVNGKLIVGKNTYASSRKINLPTSGIMVVGAGIKTKPAFLVDTERRWSGQINNLVIWNRFFNPLMLQKTSERMICDSVSKAEAWLTFEEIIAGSINHVMYSSFVETAETCGDQGPQRRKRQDEEGSLSEEDSVIEVSKNSIRINYSLYYVEPGSISKWATSTEDGVTVNIERKDMTYSVRRLNERGNIKLHPLSTLCFSGRSLKDDTAYNVDVSAHSTGLTTLQVGQQTLSVSSGTPGKSTAENVFPVGNKICITNVLSPSDYAPLDGYIESITYWTPDDATTISCPSENELLEDKGALVWPATLQTGVVSTTCQYGNAADYKKIGLATRTCEPNGWSSERDTSACAVKYTISSAEAKEYFNDITDITEENVDEFTNTINQVVQEKEEVSLDTMIIASDALEQLSASSDVKISDATMTTVVEVANTINLNSEGEKSKDKAEEAKTAAKIVESVANLAAKVELPENVKFVSKTKSVSVAAFKPPAVSSSSEGAEGSGDITASFQDDVDGTNIDISTGDNENEKTPRSVIKIKRDQVGNGKNVWFTSYQKSSTLFVSDTNFDLDGQIIGAGIGEESTKFEKGKGVLMTFYTNEDRENTNALCQYWDMKDGVGSWSSEGMTFVNKTDTTIMCEASHLTNFAILINPSNTYFTGAQELTLQIITIGGCILSIIGLLATIIGLAVFKQIRSVLTNRVHIGLSVSLLLAYIFLLIGPDLVADEGVCYFFSILVHFCFLSAFCWMLCEAINLYLRLVVVFDSYSKMFLKFSVFSFVTPLTIVLITVIVEFAGNNGAYIVENPASGVRVVCWLDYQARMAAFMLPLLLILCANFVVFILVMRVLFASKKSATAINKTQWLARLRSAVAVSTLIGLSWILGFFALGEASFAINIIFALCNSLQGVLICYLYCFAKNDVMTKWRSTIQTSFGKSSKDASGFSTSHSGAPRPQNRFNTGANTSKTTSLALSSSNTTSVTVPNTEKNGTGKFANVYSNEVSISLNEVKEKEPHYHQEDPVYSDIPQSDHEVEDDHIYEDFVPDTRPVLRRRDEQPTPEEEEKRKTITLSRNLQGQLVREKVQTFEGIIQGAEVVVTCPADNQSGGKTCPDQGDPSASFQIKSGSGASGDSKSPFDL